MNEPLKRAFTKETLSEAAKKYVAEMYDHPNGTKDPEVRDKYHTSLGMFYGFVCELFDEKPL